MKLHEQPTMTAELRGHALARGKETVVEVVFQQNPFTEVGNGLHTPII